MLSRTTNGLSLQCTHALNRHQPISGVWAIGWIPMEMFTPTHALHNVRRGWSRTWNTCHWTTVFWSQMQQSTMSGGACTHDSLLKDNHSTRSGGGRLFIDARLESPKHRVSLGLHMNYYAHRNNMHNLNGTLCVTWGENNVHWNSLKPWHSRDKANDAEWNHIDKSILVSFNEVMQDKEPTSRQQESGKTTPKEVLPLTETDMLKSRELFSALLLMRSGRQSPTTPSTPQPLPSQENAPNLTTPPPPPSNTGILQSGLVYNGLVRTRLWLICGSCMMHT